MSSVMGGVPIINLVSCCSGCGLLLADRQTEALVCEHDAFC